MSRFGLLGKITVHPGKRNEMASILLEAAAMLEDDPECDLYAVHLSPTEPETIWVTEVWSSQAAHQASLTREDVRALIARGMPLIAGGERVETIPLGGKGLPSGEPGV